jgi:Zn-dependent peptidase ImmA (M78 family)
MNIKNLLLGNINLEELLNYYNASIQYIDCIYHEIRGFVDYYKGYYFIYINRNMSYYKKKKTILHELAHIERNHLCQADNDLFAFCIDKYEDEASKYLNRLKQEICFDKYVESEV